MKRFSFFLALTLAGCAFNRPFIREQTTATNGAVTLRETKATTFALWPATADLAKQTVTAGKSLSIGTAGLEEKSGVGTNDVQLLNGIRAILGR